MIFNNNFSHKIIAMFLTEFFDFRIEYKIINTILPHNMCGHNQRYEEKYKPKNKMIKSLEAKKVDEIIF